MTVGDTDSMMSAATADFASITLDREGNEIMVLARSRLLTLVRQLVEEASAQQEQSMRTKDRGIVGEVTALVGDALQNTSGIVRRMRGAKEEPPARRPTMQELQAQLSDEVRTLELRIEQFIDLAALAGSPREYAQELRQRSNSLARLIETGEVDAAMSTETFKELTKILDLVQLTRRDVDRRTLDKPRPAARFVLAHLPTGDGVEPILSVATRTVEAWAAGVESPTEPERSRLVNVAQIVYDLRYSLTPNGIASWFGKAFEEFGGRSPVELLDDANPADIDHLRAFARGIRAQVAT